MKIHNHPSPTIDDCIQYLRDRMSDLDKSGKFLENMNFINSTFKKLEKKYTPAGEPVIDGAWNCKCGQRGNTGKYCMECGMSFADGKES